MALAGDGPCRDWLLEQLADRAPLREKVHWLGRRDDIPNLLKSADVLVQASLWEGMPNSVLEAMAAGLPVIGTAVEGTEDLVVPGQTGWLVPPHDVAALHRAFLEAIDSPERLRHYGEAGRFASNGNSHSKQPSRPTSSSGPAFLVTGFRSMELAKPAHESSN